MESQVCFLLLALSFAGSALTIEDKGVELSVDDRQEVVNKWRSLEGSKVRSPDETYKILERLSSLLAGVPKNQGFGDIQRKVDILLKMSRLADDDCSLGTFEEFSRLRYQKPLLIDNELAYEGFAIRPSITNYLEHLNSIQSFKCGEIFSQNASEISPSDRMKVERLVEAIRTKDPSNEVGSRKLPLEYHDFPEDDIYNGVLTFMMEENAINEGTLLKKIIGSLKAFRRAFENNIASFCKRIDKKINDNFYLWDPEKLTRFRDEEQAKMITNVEVCHWILLRQDTIIEESHKKFVEKFGHNKPDGSKWTGVIGWVRRS